MNEELDRVELVLRELKQEQPIWRKNWYVWSAMDPTQRHYWWERCKKQALAGVPIWQEVLVRVIEKRML